jgi:Glyoxalase-like domain
MAIAVLALSFDGTDVARLSQFWAEVLDQPVEPGATDTLAVISVPGLRLMFHQVPEGKIVKNRLHPDLSGSHYDLDTRRLLELGAVQLRNMQQDGRRWRTFADPEGNEFDLIDATP